MFFGTTLYKRMKNKHGKMCFVLFGVSLTLANHLLFSSEGHDHRFHTNVIVTFIHNVLLLYRSKNVKPTFNLCGK